MGQVDSTIPRAELEERAPTLRVGANSNVNLHMSFKRKIENSSILASKHSKKKTEIKKQHGSVVLEPHLDMKNKESMAPMHAPQGIFTHIGANMRKSIRRVEKDNYW